MSKPSYGQKAYDRGYADAMNWKVQNHLEHFEPRTWQGLTDEEIQECYNEAYKIVQGRRLENAFYKTIEAKLKERNT